MSKKFRGKTCVYCGERPSETGDHVFARQFLPESRRADLPKVPACRPCNGEKSELEHYLTATLPFGGRHADASFTLTKLVPGRLAKNLALHRLLGKGMSKFWLRERSGLIAPAVTLPFDGEKLHRWTAYLAKGLAWHHWNVVIGADCTVEVMSLTRAGESFFQRFAAMRANDRVRGNLGNGAFVYEGAQGTDNPKISVWEFTIYGGVALSEGTGATDDASSKLGVLTGPTKIFESAALKRKALSGLRGSPSAPPADQQPT